MESARRIHHVLAPWAFALFALLCALESHAGQAPLILVEPVLGSPNQVEVWMYTRAGITPVSPIQQVCSANAVGDEVCGLYVEISATGTTLLSGFSADPGVNDFFDFATGTARILRVNTTGNPAGDQGALRLGILQASGSIDSADLRLSSESEAVMADLEVQPVVHIPEPPPQLAWLAGVVLLILLRRKRLGSAVLLLPVAAVFFAAPPADAQFYLNRTGFENAIGGQFEREDFFDYPNTALSNGHDFGAFTWNSLSLFSDVTVASGLTGTLHIQGGRRGAPGGFGNPSTPKAHDTFRLDFDPPVRAAGLDIGDNLIASGEKFVIVYSDGSRLDGPLPGGTSGSGAGGFVGYVVQPGEPLISAVEVLEANDSAGDDITFDNVTWTYEFALEVAPFVPRPKLVSWQQIDSDAVGLQANDQFGSDATGLGDHDGDGVRDVAVATPLSDTAGTDRGSVWLLFLERDGTFKRRLEIVNPGGLILDGDRFGRSVESLGDIDGDGIGDLAVGTQPSGSPGDVFILFLREDGNVNSFQQIDELQGNFTGAIDTPDWFGASIARIGDLDGDSIPEIAVGAPKDDDGGMDTGAVWVLFLNSDGTVKQHQKLGAAESVFAGQLDAGDEFGHGVTGIGDLNRDGIPDLAVGAPKDDDAKDDAGAVWIVFLNLDGTTKDAQKLSLTQGGLSGVIGTQVLGQALRAGDHLGSSLEWIRTPEAQSPGVLAAGAPNMETFWWNASIEGRGAVFLITPNSDGTAGAQTGIMRSPQPLPSLPPLPEVFDPTLGETEGLGAVADLGDIDGDGFTDLFAGAAEADFPGTTGAGVGYVWFLSGLDPTAFADAVVASTGVSSGDALLGAPDSSSVDGGGSSTQQSVTVQFVDNLLRGNDGSEADLMLYRTVDGLQFGDEPVSLRIFVSEDGTTYVKVFDDSFFHSYLPLLVPLFQTFPTRLIPIDLDNNPFGANFGPDANLRFVRVEQTGTCSTPPCGGPWPGLDAIEALDNGNLVFDADFDNIPDGADNCRAFPNPDQEDSDADGVGDFCDRCPTIANADLLDGDGDGIPDACDGGSLLLLSTLR